RRAMPVPPRWRPAGHGRDGRILRQDNDFRAKEPKKRPPPGGNPGGGAVCAADSGVGPALHQLKKTDTGQCVSRPKPGHPPVLAYLATDRCPKTPGDGSLCVRTADRVRMAVLPRA